MACVFEHLVRRHPGRHLLIVNRGLYDVLSLAGFDLDRPEIMTLERRPLLKAVLRCYGHVDDLYEFIAGGGAGLGIPPHPISYRAWKCVDHIRFLPEPKGGHRNVYRTRLRVQESGIDAPGRRPYPR